MPLNKSVLEAELLILKQPPSPDPVTAAKRFAAAYVKYCLTSNAIPAQVTAAEGALASGLIGAMKTPGTPAESSAAIDVAFAAFWTAVIGGGGLGAPATPVVPAGTLGPALASGMAPHLTDPAPGPAEKTMASIIDTWTKTVSGLTIAPVPVPLPVL